jgi:hypothetical protein
MNRHHPTAALVLAMALATLSPAQKPVPSSDLHPVPLTADALELHHVAATSVTYLGRKAIRITGSDPADATQSETIAIVKNTTLENGVIEVTLSGDTAPDAPAFQRGFVGIAFRVAGADRFECIYLRPKNGRSDDQLQRNHSAQYISVPGFPWEKLRADSPGQYESYVDLVPGAWTTMKIRVQDRNAFLYVNGSDQPTLVVHDLKQPQQPGSIALWIGPGTIAHFTDLKIGR